MTKKTFVFIPFFILFIFSCSVNTDNTLIIAVDNAISPISSVVYVEAKTCSFNSTQYVGIYNDTLQTLNFSSMDSCTNVTSNNIDLFSCIGDVAGTYNSVAATCSLSLINGTCTCTAPSSATSDQVITAQKITEGLDVLIAKSISAKNSLFNNPNLCTAQTGDVNPRHICPCNLIQ